LAQEAEGKSGHLNKQINGITEGPLRGGLSICAASIIVTLTMPRREACDSQ
jgi:hypothetical protein